MATQELLIAPHRFAVGYHRQSFWNWLIGPAFFLGGLGGGLFLVSLLTSHVAGMIEPGPTLLALPSNRSFLAIHQVNLEKSSHNCVPSLKKCSTPRDLPSKSRQGTLLTLFVQPEYGVTRERRSKRVASRHRHRTCLHHRVRRGIEPFKCIRSRNRS